MSHVGSILSGMSSVRDRHNIGRDVPRKDIVYVVLDFRFSGVQCLQFVDDLGCD